MEHAVKIVHSEVEHPDEAVVNDGGSVLEDAVGLLVLEQLVQAALYDVAILMRLQLSQDDVDELDGREDGGLFAVDEQVEGLPDVFDEMGAVAAEDVEEPNEHLAGSVALAEAGC